MSSSAPQLEYAPAAPLRRRKRIRRVIALVLVLGLGIAGWRYHAPVWAQTKLLYHQHRCLAYTAPAEQIVYDENDDGTSPLMGLAEYSTLPPAPTYSTFSIPTTSLSSVVIRSAPALADFATVSGTPPLAFQGATVF